MAKDSKKFFAKGPWLSLIIGVGFIYPNIMVIYDNTGLGIMKNHIYYIPIFILSLFFIRSTLKCFPELIASVGICFFYILEFILSFRSHISFMLRDILICFSFFIGFMFIYFWYDGYMVDGAKI